MSIEQSPAVTVIYKGDDRWTCHRRGTTCLRKRPTPAADRAIAQAWRNRGHLGPPACCAAGADRLLNWLAKDLPAEQQHTPIPDRLKHHPIFATKQ